jgi:hypothetical protein
VALGSGRSGRSGGAVELYVSERAAPLAYKWDQCIQHTHGAVSYTHHGAKWQDDW